MTSKKFLQETNFEGELEAPVDMEADVYDEYLKSVKKKHYENVDRWRSADSE